MKKQNYSNNGLWIVVGFFTVFFLAVLVFLYMSSGLFIIMYSGHDGFELINRTIPDLLIGLALIVGGVVLFLLFNGKSREKI